LLQAAFEKWQKHWEWCICKEGETSRLMVANRPKGFDQISAPVPEIMDMGILVSGCACFRTVFIASYPVIFH
jgi:hypothetical protein